jgi:hypothetical protein
MPFLQGTLNRHRFVLAEPFAILRRARLKFRAVAMPDSASEIGPMKDSGGQHMTRSTMVFPDGVIVPRKMRCCESTSRGESVVVRDDMARS